MIDIHAHILPSLDDGPKTVEESIEMCKVAASDGISTIVATPHSKDGVYEAKGENILIAVEALNLELQKSHIDLKILPGAELHVNERLLEGIENGDALTMNNNRKHILLELPFFFIPPGTERLIFNLQSLGIIPIIAHAERISFFQKNPKSLEKLVESGVMVQVTAQSITGFFGSRERKCAERFLKRKTVHFIASDAHSPRNRPPVLSKALEKASRIIGKEEAEALVFKNPREIITLHTDAKEDTE
jgi:protein-tyrosine phosphatase